MSEKKHIDRLFQEKFKDFEAAPKENVWKNIAQKLTDKKPQKTVLFPFWQKIAGVAALLAVAFLIGDFAFDNSAEEKTVNSEENTLEKTDGDKIPSETILENTLETQNAVVLEETKRETEAKNSTLNEKNSGSSNQATKNLNDRPINGTDDLTEIVSTKTKNEQQQKVSENRVGKNSAEENSSSEISRSKNQGLAAVENSAKVPSSSKDRVSVSEKTNANPPKKEETFASLTPENNSKNELEKTKNSSANENKKSLVEVAAAQHQPEEQPEKNLETDLTATSKWQIKPFAAPVYSGGFGSENALDPSLAQNNSNSEVTFSYGVNFSYKISKRLKIRSGVGQVSMAHNVDNIAFVSAIKPVALRNVSYSAEGSHLEIVNAGNVVGTTGTEISGKSPYTKGTLHQQLGFIEVPLEVEYALLDKKFGVSIIGGASTLFLNENTLAIKSGNGTTNIGEANNLNNTSFSTNIGLGLDYNVSKKIEINLEPMFKYQINTFGQNSNGFQPYYFGVYTGIGLKF